MTILSFLGPRGTFSEEAAHKFDREGLMLPAPSIPDVFEMVLNGKSDYGVVPVENSIEGGVVLTLDLLLESDVKICQEIILDVEHCLLAHKEASLEDIQEVYSHPHALAQCKKFLASLKDVKTRNFSSTAEAAKEVSRMGTRDVAAIGSKVAARLYGLHVLEKGIQDEKGNQTRFFVIGEKCIALEGDKKTSVVVGLKDRAGALYDLLAPFAKEGINLTRIESRPTKKGLGDYIFYIDFLGDSQEGSVKKILQEISDEAAFFKVLGTYLMG